MVAGEGLEPTVLHTKTDGVLSQYVRVGSKERKIYDYSVAERNPVVPFSSDDFVASIKLNFGERNTLVGMTLNLYVLEFTLTI